MEWPKPYASRSRELYIAEAEHLGLPEMQINGPDDVKGSPKHYQAKYSKYEVRRSTGLNQSANKTGAGYTQSQHIRYAVRLQVNYCDQHDCQEQSIERQICNHMSKRQLGEATAIKSPPISR